MVLSLPAPAGFSLVKERADTEKFHVWASLWSGNTGAGLAPLELWLCFALIPAFWSEAGYDELLGSAAFVTSCPPGRMKLHGGPPQPAGQCH